MSNHFQINFRGRDGNHAILIVLFRKKNIVRGLQLVTRQNVTWKVLCVLSRTRQIDVEKVKNKNKSKRAHKVCIYAAIEKGMYI